MSHAPIVSLSARGRQHSPAVSSEGGFRQIHDREIGPLGDDTFGGQLGEHRTRKPAARAHLAFVEGLLIRRKLLIEPVERYLGSAKQQPCADQVAERHKQSRGVQAHFVNVASIAVSWSCSRIARFGSAYFVVARRGKRLTLCFIARSA